MQIDRNSLKAILWDMDGTLVDTEPMWIQCEADLMSDFGYVWGDEDAHFCIGGPMEKVQRYMALKSGSDIDPSWFGNRLVEMMLERMESGVELKDGVLDLLHDARNHGLKQAIVSASRRPIVDAVIAGLGFPFDHSISATEVSISKPHPEGYVKAASYFAVDIESCVIFEDSSTGIRSGLDSGALTLGLTEQVFDHSNFIRIGDLKGLEFAELLMMHRDWREGVEKSGARV